MGDKAVVRTVCTLDCPDACGLEVRVAKGAVASLRGSAHHPVTRGFTCAKIHRYAERVLHGPRRVRAPLIRRGEAFVEASFEAALEVVAERVGRVVEEFGWHSVFAYQGLGSTGATKMYVKRLFNALPAHTTFSGGICGAAGIAAQTLDFGYRRAHQYDDALNSDAIVLWGRNPAATSVHFMATVREARRRGALAVVIDPVRTETADAVDRWISVVPGRDRFLAAYVLKRVFERCDVSSAEARGAGLAAFGDVVRSLGDEFLVAESGATRADADFLAELFCSGARVGIWPGWGLQRHTKGGLTFRLLDALSFLTGNVGVSGGGVNHGFDEWRFFDQTLAGTSKNVRTTPIGTLSRAIRGLVEPPVKAIFVFAGNPVSQLPRGRDFGAFMREAFSVVVDGLMTETAACADVVLPATLLFETDDLVGSYGHHVVGRARRVVEAPAGTRSDVDIVNGLADAFGLAGFGLSTDDVLLRAAAPLGDEGARLAVGEADWMACDEDPVAYRHGFATEDGRFQFVPLEREDFVSEPQRGVWLISAHHAGDMHSQGLADRSRVILAPEGTVESEGPVVLEGARAELRSKVEFCGRISAGAILVYEGGEDGHNANDLVDPGITDLGDGVPFYSTTVTVRPGGAS